VSAERDVQDQLRELPAIARARARTVKPLQANSNQNSSARFVWPLRQRARELRPVLFAICAILIGAALSGAVAAQTDRTPDAPSIQPTVSRAQIEAKLNELEEQTDVSEETRQTLTDRYRSALTNLDALQAFEAEAKGYIEALDSAPKEAAALRAESQALATLPDPPVDLPKQVSVTEIEQLLAREQAEAASLEAQLEELEKALGEHSEQPTEVRKRIAQASEALAELDAELKRPQPADQRADVQQARTWALETQRDALRAEMVMLDQKIVSADARRRLTEARRDQRAAALAQLKEQRAFLENEADRLRRLEAERLRQEAASAERELADADPIVQALARRNRDISELISRITENLDRIDERQATLDEALRETREHFKSARERVSAAGLSQTVGRILFDERADLPSIRGLHEQARQRAEEIAEITLEQLRLRDSLRELQDPSEAVDQVLADAGSPGAGVDLRDQVTEQLLRQRDLLEQALRVQDSYQRAIGDLDFTADQYVDLLERYRDFLAEHLLWVRSTAPINEQDFAPAQSAVWWLIAPEHWFEVLPALGLVARTSPLFWLGLVGFGVLLALGPRLRKRIRSYAEPMRRISTDRFSYSVSTLGWTLLLAAPWPLLAALVGWQLSRVPTAAAFAQGIGQGLLVTALPFYYLRVSRLLCMPGGLADRHFRWSAATLKRFRQAARVTTITLLPIGLFAAALGHQNDPGFDGTLTRLAVVILSLGLAMLTAWLMHPDRGIVAEALLANPKGLLYRTRYLWFAALVAAPVLVAAISLAGYLYTAGILLSRLVSELWLALILFVAHQMIVRWLIVTRRGLALEAALGRRAQREAQRVALEQGAQPLDTGDDSVDLASLDNQTRRLLNSSIVIIATVGLWLIWSDVLPALTFFDRLTLWSYTTEIDGTKELIPVTLADIGLILIIGAAALVAVKNLPALLEILLLKNSTVSAGGRYTLVTLTGYFITAVAVLLIVGTLGLRWSQVQWLIAALGVGIGFGLQEIVANFISGLIILFERPVRVGDIVTIGDTTGTVSKIEIRATTIRNWDRQELLVPNKEFITGRVLNWTLSDQMNRVVIPVGVEYGSNTRTALKLLQEVAAEHPLVLEDPAPLITFEGFGDNALTMVLRCYLETLEFRMAVTTELHQAIDDKFRAAGIGIAFPQRDIHLRSAEPLEIRMSRADRPGNDEPALKSPSSAPLRGDPELRQNSLGHGTT
jgi:potassium efflux system protein